MTLRLPGRPVLIWLLGLAVILIILAGRFSTTSDLTAFLPQSGAQETPLNRLLAADFQSSWLILGIRDGTPELRERHHFELARALTDSALFATVLGPIPPPMASFLPDSRRYLLTDPAQFDPSRLQQAFQEQQRRLGAPTPVDRQALQHDPTSAWSALQTVYPFDAPPAAGASDTDTIALRADDLTESARRVPLLSAVDALLAPLREAGLTVEWTGPALHAQHSEERIRSEINRLMGWAGFTVLLILLLSYRPRAAALLILLPPLTGLLAGLALVTLLFGEVHGIAIAFAAILIGISVDYAIHLFSHYPQRARIRRTLLLSAATSIFALLSWTFSGIPGLIQVGLLTAFGLLVAALTSLHVLPALMGGRAVGPRRIGWSLPRVSARTSRHLSLALILAAAGGIALAPGPTFDDRPPMADLIPDEHLQIDERLRAALNLPDTRYRILVEAEDVQTLLQRQEALAERLDTLASQGTLSGALGAWQYLPSERRQQRRQQALPDRAALEEQVRNALEDTAFAPAAFDPFIDDVQAARKTTTVTADVLATLSPARVRMLEHLLVRDPDRHLGPVWLYGLDAAGAAQLAEALQQEPLLGTHWLDLRDEIHTAMVQTRARALWLAVIGLLVILLLIAVPMSNPSPPLIPAKQKAAAFAATLDRVSLPVLAALIGTVAALRLLGESLSLFHVVALVLVAGLAADYRLFLCRHDASAEGPATSHALMVALLSSASVFALLSRSDILILHELGITVLIGIVLALLPEWWVTVVRVFTGSPEPMRAADGIRPIAEPPRPTPPEPRVRTEG